MSVALIANSVIRYITLKSLEEDFCQPVYLQPEVRLSTESAMPGSDVEKSGTHIACKGLYT